MNFDKPINVGLRNRENKKLIAIYPESIQGKEEDVKKKLFDWYYKQSCGAEDDLKILYLDVVSKD